MKELDYWSKAHKFLLKTSRPYPLLHGVLKKNGALEVRGARGSTESDLFNSMCRTITGQQLSTQAARSLWGKVLSLCESRKQDLYSICDGKSTRYIKACGLSGNKVKAMERLRDSFQDNSISKEILESLEDEQVITTISNLWGFGPWSAEMILIGYLGREDVWSFNDSSLHRGITLALKDEINLTEIVEGFSPYRTILARHIWKALDEGLLVSG